MTTTSRRIFKHTLSQFFIVALFGTATFGQDAPKDSATEPAIGGHDPVAYFIDGKPVKGDAAHKASFAGKTYYFTSEESKKKFEQDPEKYVPQYDSLCTTALGGMYGNRLPPDPSVFEVRENRLYLFSSERAKKAYEKNPGNYIKQATERFSKPALQGRDLVSSQEQGKSVMGEAAFSTAYDGWVYHFASAAAMMKFRENPAKYMPQFGNYCAAGIAGNKRFPADGTRLRVHEGKTYLLFDDAAEKEFDKDAASLVKKANENWPGIKKMDDDEKAKKYGGKKNP